MKQSKALLVAGIVTLLAPSCMQAMEGSPVAKRGSSSSKPAEMSLDNFDASLCNPHANCSPELLERVKRIEALLGGQEAQRGVKESAMSVFEKFKYVFSKLKGIRKEVKDHEEQIVAAKDGLDSLSNALGSPALLEKLSDGADSAFTGLVQLDAKVVAHAKELQAFKEQQQPHIDLLNQLMSGEAKIPELSSENAPQVMAQLIALCGTLQGQLNEQKEVTSLLMSKKEEPEELSVESAVQKKRSSSKRRSSEKKKEK